MHPVRVHSVSTTDQYKKCGIYLHGFRCRFVLLGNGGSVALRSVTVRGERTSFCCGREYIPLNGGKEGRCCSLVVQLERLVLADHTNCAGKHNKQQVHAQLSCARTGRVQRGQFSVGLQRVAQGQQSVLDQLIQRRCAREADLQILDATENVMLRTVLEGLKVLLEIGLCRLAARTNGHGNVVKVRSGGAHCNRSKYKFWQPKVTRSQSYLRRDVHRSRRSRRREHRHRMAVHRTVACSPVAFM